MRVTIDEDRCRGHGICCVVCPEVFDLDDDGFTIVRTPEVPAESEEAARTAIKQCPEGAISEK